MSSPFKSIFPLKPKDWKPDNTQIGVFYRNPDGAIIEISVDAATIDQRLLAAELVSVMLKYQSEHPHRVKVHEASP